MIANLLYESLLAILLVNFLCIPEYPGIIS